MLAQPPACADLHSLLLVTCLSLLFSPFSLIPSCSTFLPQHLITLSISSMLHILAYVLPCVTPPCTLPISRIWNILQHSFTSIKSLRVPLTGGKGSITQWVHVEYMVGSETICPPFTQWVKGGYFLKVPTMCLSHSLWVLSKSTHQFDHNVPSHIPNGFFESLWEN